MLMVLEPLRAILTIDNKLCAAEAALPLRDVPAPGSRIGSGACARAIASWVTGVEYTVMGRLSCQCIVSS